ncbi:MAG: nucleotidyltransferase substrate binding protein [Desulfuromonadales bacterium]|nr:nucleotidyltransferase substrate binding protein [Desulfuromonadales bacterium]MDT8423231.1 nucleotidyltransferase substrate binding protein [Desulfuromonadales bacterium]
MDRERLVERIEEYLKALSQLEKALAQPKDEFIRDSVIQRFEFTHELAWKMLKLKLEAEGLSVRTPREALQEALQAGLTEDGNRWTDMLKMRNLTSHTYREKLADDVYVFVGTQALPLFRQLATKCRTW